MALFIDPRLLMKYDELDEPDEFVTRDEWKAEKPKKSKSIDDNKFPLPHIVLMYTNTPPCHSKTECKKAIQELQKKHMAEGAPDIKHNYLISTDGTIYEGSSPKLVTMTYGEDDEKLSKANENSVNIAIIDDGKVKEPTEQLTEETTKLAAKLMRDAIVTGDFRLLWFDHNGRKKNIQSSFKRKKKQVSNNNNKEYPDNTTPVKSISGIKTHKSVKKLKENKSAEFNDKVVRGKATGPFILEPDYIRTLVTESDKFAYRGDDYDTYF